MNIISGNCAGTFSGFLSFLAWMKVAEDPSNDLNVFLHTRNKTAWPGASYSNYKWIHSTQFENEWKEILSVNMLHKLFKDNKHLTRNFPTEFDYVETYPADVRHRVNNYPNCFKYEARGGLNDQYYDLENLNLTRNALKEQWDKFEFTDYFNERVKEEEKLIEGKKVLCLMMRSASHYLWPFPKEFSDNMVNKAIQCVKDRIDDYDVLLLTTCIQPYIDKFVEVFGDKCVYTERKRIKEEREWKGADETHFQVLPEPSMSDEDYSSEYEDCILDVLLSSKSDMILGASSNMFLACLCMNPSLPFDIYFNHHGY